MTTLHWSTTAEADVENITDYISQHNLLAAVEMRDAIETRVKALKMFPEGWKTGRVAGTREMVLAGTSYIAIYDVGDGTITILRILHSSQKWPPQ
jgi:toxin ParE1/3/4